MKPVKPKRHRAIDGVSATAANCATDPRALDIVVDTGTVEADFAHWPQVGGITAFTSIDFPGALAAVLYCQGCPWRCRYCHNPELLPPRSKARHTWPAILKLLHRRQGLLDAVVFSGGEPLIQPGLAQAVDAVRGLGFKAGLHSGGCVPQRLEEIVARLDWVGLDVKALPQHYPAITQTVKARDAVWDSLDILLASGIEFECRTTVFWSLTPAAEVLELGRLLSARGVRSYAIQIGQTRQCLDPELMACENRIDSQAAAVLTELEGLFEHFSVRGAG